MIEPSVVFSLFRKWRDAPTVVRADAELAGAISFSFECTVVRADNPLVSLGLADCGFIEFVLGDTWGFDFMALDVLRIELNKRTGKSPLGDRRYEFGEVIVAVRTIGSTRSWMRFAEVVREL